MCKKTFSLAIVNTSYVFRIRVVYSKAVILNDWLHDHTWGTAGCICRCIGLACLGDDFPVGTVIGYSRNKDT